MSDWPTDCLHHHGRVLRGLYSHYCPDWDYMPLDETCDAQYECCVCTIEFVQAHQLPVIAQ